MSKEVISHLLHGHVMGILEEMGRRNLAYEMEKEGTKHPISHHLDKALHYAEHGGVNCRRLREGIERNIDIGKKTPSILRQYLQRPRARGEIPGVRKEIAA